MPRSKQVFTKYLRITESLYVLMIILSFYLLLISRTGEARTIWEVLHPYFIPTLFATTFLLLTLLFTSEKVEYKLLFVIAHSILIHSFFSIIFPAGDLSGQQMALGRTRLVFDNAVLHGWTSWPMGSVQSRIFEWIGGTNFQIALSVVFARMSSIDILYVHLFLVPVSWGVFVPIASFYVTKTLGGGEKASVLSSLLVSAFPYATYFGAVSVSNSLGFIFFFYSLYFMLKYLSSNDSNTVYLMVAFSSFALLSHYLTGIISFSLLFLALAFRSYKIEESSPTIAKISLVSSSLFCASLLPVSLIYLGFFRPKVYTVFTLSKFYELPIDKIVGLFFLGELAYTSDLKAILLVFIGPLVALSYMVYLLYKLKRNPAFKSQIHILFLFTAFLMILVDYRILKLFMDGLPFNEERLWVFRDLIAAPFVALAVYAVVSSIKAFLKAKSPPPVTVASIKACLKSLSKRVDLRVSDRLFAGFFFSLNLLLSLLLAGWVSASLSIAYPQVPITLQTTWYELEAVKYIEENTHEKYVVIGDIWTIYAGEVIVGIVNPRAYYFAEFNKTGYDLFVNMTREPSPRWMLQAMNFTDTTVAYFIVTKPRVDPEEYSRITQQAQQNGLQTDPRLVFYYKGEEKLRIFYYKKFTMP